MNFCKNGLKILGTKYKTYWFITVAWDPNLGPNLGLSPFVAKYKNILVYYSGLGPQFRSQLRPLTICCEIVRRKGGGGGILYT
jgi:hypothetical protein